MRNPKVWLMAGVLVFALTAGIETPAARSQDRQGFDYYSFDALPDASSTSLQGINARGDMVGAYTKNGVTHGFLWSDSVLTTIDYPGARSTEARGINSRGDIVGAYRVSAEPPVNIHGYLLPKNGDGPVPLDFPGHTSTIPQRITANGLILGCRHDTDTMGTMRGITMNAKDSSDVGETDAFASMHNGAAADGGLIVGLYTDMDTNRGRGYLLYGGTEFVPFDVPGSTFTAAWDVNPSGAVVGVYRDAANVPHGFVWSGLQFESIDFPGAVATRAIGINSRGTIVGSYNEPGGRTRGFVAVPR